MSTASAAAPPAAMTFREVLRIDVSSTNISVALGAQIVGLLLSGVLADLFGVRTVFFVCAALALALAAGGRAFLHAKK